MHGFLLALQVVCGFSPLLNTKAKALQITNSQAPALEVLVLVQEFVLYYYFSTLGPWVMLGEILE